MIVVHVHMHAKPDKVDTLRNICIENARNSIKEKGIARFDVLQQQDDSERFVLIEVYRTQEAIQAHKESNHYWHWRDKVENLLVEPRYSIKYASIFPND
jgi:autoinducer 2-degrading protein